jgi:hypothetical protein
MTEAEWLVCEAPQEMYAFLRERMTTRCCRLFANACGRRHCFIWERKKYSNAEEADYWLAQKEETDRICRAILDAVDEECDGVPRGEAIESLRNKVFQRGPLGLTWDLTATVKGDVDYWVMRRFPPLPSSAREQASLDMALLWELHAEGLFQVNMLREIVGNPFRPPQLLPASVLAWNDGTVRRIAEGIYEERRMPEGTFDTGCLAILADALVDAGCDNNDLIQHCRSEKPHVRGCWAVDAILGKS